MTRERLSVVLSSGTLDQLTAAGWLIAGAVESGLDVELLLTINGLMGFRKGAAAELYDNAEAEPMGRGAVEGLQEQRVPPYVDLLRTARALGRLRIYACDQSLRILRLSLADLEDGVDGAMTMNEFMTRARGSRNFLHI